MNVKMLREALGDVRGGLSSVELAALNEVLLPLDDLTVGELCSMLAKIKKPKPKAGSATNIEAVIARYIDELKSSQKESAAFTAVIDRLKADRIVKVREATLIAQAFLSDKRDYKSKPLALKAIAARQLADERSASRRGRVSDIF